MFCGLVLCQIIGLIAPEFLIDGVNINKPFKYKKQISKNLWKLPVVFPLKKQIQKMNKGFMYNKPMLINGEVNS